MSDVESVSELAASLVLANRILVRHQVLDGFGHVSARHPGRSDRFLLAKRMAPAQVGVEDIIQFDLAAEPVADRTAPVFLERYIHAAIYAARPEVRGIVHSHSPAIVTVGVVPGAPFRAICHTCGFLQHPVPVFEIRDHAGDDSDLLIRNRELGDALTRVLAKSAVVLMRGHGSTATGGSLQQAVYRAIYSEVNARVQLAAAPFGAPTFLTAAEAEAAEATASLQVERNWEHWCAQVRAPTQEGSR